MSYGLRLALIDADEMVREGRVLLLQSQPEMQIVFQTGDAGLALESIGEYLLDVVIVDTRVPGWRAEKYIAELGSRLDEADNEAQILALASFASAEFELACLKAGVSAFVTSDLGVATLLRQLKVLGAGERSISRKYLEGLLAEVVGQPAPHPGLALSLESMDANQSAVLKAMLEGLSDAQIAREQQLTKYRVTKFLESLRESSGFRTRNQLAIELLGLGVN